MTFPTPPGPADANDANDDPHVIRHNLDDEISDTDGDADAPRGRYHLWWATYAPETYALTALILAIASFILVEASNDFVQAYNIGHQTLGRTTLDIGNGIRAGIGAVAALLAAWSITLEDEDTSWSAPVARTALAIGVLGLVFALAAIIAAHTGSSPGPNGFGQ